MKDIRFVTGNKRKLHDATVILETFGVKVEQVELYVDEIQSHDPASISEHKAKQAFQMTKQPLVVNDASWSMPGLNGFPGGYLKDMVAWFTAEDFVALIRDKEDKRVCITETVTYIDNHETRVFKSELWGRMITEPRGEGNAIERVAEFDGHTLAEAHARSFAVGDVSGTVWHAFGEWYSRR